MRCVYADDELEGDPDIRHTVAHSPDAGERHRDAQSLSACRDRIAVPRRALSRHASVRRRRRAAALLVGKQADAAVVFVDPGFVDSKLNSRRVAALAPGDRHVTGVLERDCRGGNELHFEIRAGGRERVVRHRQQEPLRTPPQYMAVLSFGEKCKGLNILVYFKSGRRSRWSACVRMLSTISSNCPLRFRQEICARSYPLFDLNRSLAPTKPPLCTAAFARIGGALMRIGLVAAAICLCVIGSAGADGAKATIRKDTSIPAEALAPALQTIAKEYDFQVLYRTEVVGSLRTEGVIGEFTPDEALKLLLRGTGLTYRYLDERTITILPVSSGSGAIDSDPKSGGINPLAASQGTQEEGRTPSSGASFPTQAASGKDPGTAPAADPPRKRNSEAAEPSLQEVIVTAQKRSQSLIDVPIEISVLSGQELDRSPVQGVTEALNQVPGVVAMAVNQGGGTQIAVRGVSASGPVFNGSSPIGYYLDWIPFGLVKTAIAPDSDAFDLDRVEVLRGPQGTLYGASALNGVVRVLTEDPDLNNFELKGRIISSDTESGGGGNYRGDMAVNAPVVDGKLAIRAVVGYEDDSGWIDGPLGNHLNNGELRNYRLKVKAKPIDSLSIELSAWSTRDNFGAPAASSPGNRISSPIPEPMSTDYDAYNAHITYTFSDAVVSSSTSDLQYHDRSQLSIPIAGLASFPYHTFLDSNVVSEELSASSRDIGPWRWFVGSFYRDGTDRVRQDIPTILGIDWGDGSKSYALFGEFGRRFFDDKFEWTLGLRNFHDQVYSRQNQLDLNDVNPSFLYNKTENFSATTPRAVLTWYPSPNLTAYASYSQGFRSGFPQYSSVAKTYPEFPAVQPDKLSNYEIGSKMELLDKRLSIDTAVYYMDWRDVQQTLNVPVANTSVYVTAPVNGQSASGTGVDLAVLVRPVRGLTLGVNGSWNNLQLDRAIYSSGVLLFNKGDRLNCSPELTAGASIDYTFPLGASGYAADMDATANYISTQYQRTLDAAVASGVTNLSSSELVLGRAAISLVSPNYWTASLFVDNFTNENGAAAPPSNPLPDWTPRIRPRTIGLEFNFNY